MFFVTSFCSQKMELVFATNNRHKLEEVRLIAGKNHKINGLDTLNCYDDIPETADTLQGNALLKATYVYDRYGCNCFADDTGLEIEALDGRPGVYSARYAGEGCAFEDNIKKVLTELKGVTNRRACFKTVIALILAEKKYFFEGTIHGQIIEQGRGIAGFGYDPVFIPDGYDKTFAEMEANEKNSISHRAIAMQKMIFFLPQERGYLP